MTSELILWCVPESRAVARIRGGSGERVTKSVLTEGLSMMAEDDRAMSRILKGSRNGAELLCPYCGNRLALARDGQHKADITENPIHVPLGSFRLPS